MATAERDLYQFFAALLGYPTPGLASAARHCAATLVGPSLDAARLVEAFARFVDSTPPGRLEETYTAMFELDATTPPYVGYHLFGESYKRSAFLVRLREACRAAGVDPGTEVADHVAIVLALLAATEDEELRLELAHDALAPVLERMLGPARGGDGQGGEPADPCRDGAAPDAAVPPELAADPDGDAESDRYRNGRDAYRGVLRALQLVLVREPLMQGRS